MQAPKSGMRSMRRGRRRACRVFRVEEKPSMKIQSLACLWCACLAMSRRSGRCSLIEPLLEERLRPKEEKTLSIRRCHRSQFSEVASTPTSSADRYRASYRPICCHHHSLFRVILAIFTLPSANFPASESCDARSVGANRVFYPVLHSLVLRRPVPIERRHLSHARSPRGLIIQRLPVGAVCQSAGSAPPGGPMAPRFLVASNLHINATVFGVRRKPLLLTTRRPPGRAAMDSEAFRKHGKEMVDFIADYWTGMRERTPLPDVQPGYIWDLVPSSPPENPEPWTKIFEDLEPVVLKANTNWHHPHFFAYYPTSLSYPSIMADMLSGAIASIGFTWKSSPSMTELEMVCTDWLVKALGLPDFFLNSDDGPGAGMIQSTASDATLVALLAARSRAVNKYKKQQESTKLGWVYSNVSRIFSKVSEVRREPHSDIINPENHDPAVLAKLIAYTSDQAHSSVEKDAMLAGVKLRKLRSAVDELLGNFGICAEALEAAIAEDRAAGLIPFILVATIGTTSTCGVDSLVDLGPICNREGLWLHVDAAYAGSYLICPEYRYLAKGVEMVDSFNFNAHKALMINFDCSPMWFKDATEAASYFDVDPVYLKHEHQKKAADLRHLQIALGRRFRSLKIWFVLRALGIEHIQKHLRTMEQRAKEFAEIVTEDGAFELFVPQHLGLVCFRLKGDNEENERLTAAVNDDRRIHLVPSTAHGVFFLRLAVCNSETSAADIRFAVDVIKEISQKIA
ncbi:hypothetical protein QR680_013013 [Steinernema hermaphroditum]|uniref:Aromatic-L-amino-acid decarboxylase n=1 Tax=Steinernema hermaphroditum TaxID=289476 RepID=A0AA39I6X5_9BILA|nr:hypothetical protein QR680_013013 [Steinernema hermaphroditum]